MSTLKATLPAHLARASTAKKPLILGPRILVSLALAWVGLLASAFLIGLTLA